MASQVQNLNSSANNDTQAGPVTRPLVPPSITPAQQLVQQLPNTPPATPAPDSAGTTPTSYGPTLEFKNILEGRPITDQSGKMFVGIASGTPTAAPQYILSFTVDVPASGFYSGLSLAGLTQGSQYTAYLKGQAQIATSSAFIMAPNTTQLNSDQPLTLLTGDLNDDNVINSADLSIAKQAMSSTSTSPNWNPLVDFNKDGVVNSADLALILKNFGKTGTSGMWVSPVPTASPSASVPSGIGGPSASDSANFPHPNTGSGGYWMWVPQ